MREHCLIPSTFILKMIETVIKFVLFCTNNKFKYGTCLSLELYFLICFNTTKKEVRIIVFLHIIATKSVYHYMQKNVKQAI